MTPYERVMRRTKRIGECLEFTGAKISGGYGQVEYRDASQRRWNLHTHRVVWAHHRGCIPKGMFVCHHCDNRSCVELSHLFLGTHKDNMRDMRNKGRSNYGEKNGGSKLTWGKVAKIRERLAHGENQYFVAADFGVSQATISFIGSHKLWRVT